MEATNHRHIAMLLFIFFMLVLQNIHVLASSQKQSDESNHFSSLLDSAEILKLKGFYDEAITICINVQEKSHETKDWENYTRSLVEHADILRFSYYFSRNEEEIDQALMLVKEAKNSLFANLNLDNIIWIRFYIYMGKLHRYIDQENNNNTDSLLIYLNKAKEISLIYPTQYHELAKVNYELGNYYFNSQRMTEAKPFIENLLDITINQLPEFDYFRALYLEKIGSYYADVGDIERSALCLENALFLYENKQDDIHNTIKTRLNLGNTYFYNNESEKALQIYKKVMEDAQRSNLATYSRSLLTLKNASILLFNLGLLDSCIYISNKALELNRHKTATDKYNSSILKLNLARSQFKRFPREDISDLFNQSLNEMTEVAGEKSFRIHAIYRSIGETLFDHDELDSALFFYQKGLISLYESFNDSDIYTNPDFGSYENMEPVLYIIFDKAKTLYRRYLKNGNTQDLLASLTLYEKSYDIMSGLINDGFMDESIIILFQKFKHDFQMSVNCASYAFQELEDMKYFEIAFKFIEQSRYFLLLKSQQNTLLRERIGIADSLFLEERNISKNIEFLKHHLNQEKQTLPEEQYNIRNSILKNLLYKDRIWERIEKYKPKQYKDSFVTLHEVRENTSDENDIILEYYRSDSSFLLLVIGKKLSEIIEIPTSLELQNHIEEYSQSVTINNTKLSRQHFHAFVNSSFQLYEKLLKPALELLQKDNQQSARDCRYTIVPDGELSFLPFEAFTTQLADTSSVSYWSLPYVCREYIISYAFSLNVMQTSLTYRNRKSSANILAISFSDSTKDLQPTSIKNNFDELPYSALEAASPGRYFTGADIAHYTNGTRRQFMKEASNVGIIHLAIHGLADSTNRFDSKLIFRPESEKNDTGELFAYELYNLDLSNTQLAVLSACETGIGKQVEGEGIFSIARGFAYAGCPSLVMSLWRANDKSTYLLMDHFYENLASGMKKDVALQEAKISFISEMNDYDAHPSNWATFIALGNNNPVQLKNGSMSNYFIYGIILIAIISALVYRKKITGIF